MGLFSYTIIWYDYQTIADSIPQTIEFSYTIIWYDYQTVCRAHSCFAQFSYTIIWYDYQTTGRITNGGISFSYTIIWYDYQTGVIDLYLKPGSAIRLFDTTIKTPGWRILWNRSFSYTIIWYDYQTSNWLERILCSLRQWPQNTYNLLLLSYHKMSLYLAQISVDNNPVTPLYFSILMTLN